MPQVALYLMVIALVAVVLVLLAGVFTMARGGDFNKKYGNRLMRARVVLQAFAVLIFAVVWLVTRN
ncbi:MAG: twin transmembrane helix small protein [Alphaproteobacteria bacterium]|nr:twin transmembrane helix small protein [Alphaproteobacteria bacterium]